MIGSSASRRWSDPSRRLAELIYCSVANGVHSLHALFIIHADLSARNVLVRGSPSWGALFEVKVSDFGCSLNEGEQVNISKSVGALAARSPELLLQQRPVMTSTDLWSIGAIGFMLVVGVADDSTWPLASDEKQSLRGIRRILGKAPMAYRDGLKLSVPRGFDDDDLPWAACSEDAVSIDAALVSSRVRYPLASGDSNVCRALGCTLQWDAGARPKAEVLHNSGLFETRSVRDVGDVGAAEDPFFRGLACSGRAAEAAEESGRSKKSRTQSPHSTHAFAAVAASTASVQWKRNQQKEVRKQPMAEAKSADGDAVESKSAQGDDGAFHAQVARCECNGHCGNAHCVQRLNRDRRAAKSMDKDCDWSFKTMLEKSREDNSVIICEKSALPSFSFCRDCKCEAKECKRPRARSMPLACSLYCMMCTQRVVKSKGGYFADGTLMQFPRGWDNNLKFVAAAASSMMMPGDAVALREIVMSVAEPGSPIGNAASNFIQLCVSIKLPEAIRVFEEMGVPQTAEQSWKNYRATLVLLENRDFSSSFEVMNGGGLMDASTGYCQAGHQLGLLRLPKELEKLISNGGKICTRVPGCEEDTFRFVFQGKLLVSPPEGDFSDDALGFGQNNHDARYLLLEGNVVGKVMKLGRSLNDHVLISDAKSSKEAFARLWEASKIVESMVFPNAMEEVLPFMDKWTDYSVVARGGRAADAPPKPTPAKKPKASETAPTQPTEEFAMQDLVEESGLHGGKGGVKYLVKCATRVMLMAMRGDILDDFRLAQLLPYIPDENNHVGPVIQMKLSALRPMFAPVDPLHLPMWACLVGFAKVFKAVAQPKEAAAGSSKPKGVAAAAAAMQLEKARLKNQDQAIQWARIGHPVMDAARVNWKKRDSDGTGDSTASFPPGPHKMIDAAFDFHDEYEKKKAKLKKAT